MAFGVWAVGNVANPEIQSIVGWLVIAHPEGSDNSRWLPSTQEAYE